MGSRFRSLSLTTIENKNRLLEQAVREGWWCGFAHDPISLSRASPKIVKEGFTFMNKLSEFRNEPYTDFSLPENRQKMEAALRKVKAEFGKDYDLLVAGERVSTPDKLKSLNPSRPAEIVGTHSKATSAIAQQAIEKAYSYFPKWSATPAMDRVEMLLRAGAMLRERKLEFDAWLCYEAARRGPKLKPK